MDSLDRQDKGADHYSDRIRSPARSLKLYNRLMLNERCRNLNLNELDKIRDKNISENLHNRKFYLKKLETFLEAKRFYTTIESISNINLNDKTNNFNKNKKQNVMWFKARDAKSVSTVNSQATSEFRPITSAFLTEPHQESISAFGFSDRYNLQLLQNERIKIKTNKFLTELRNLKSAPANHRC